jgi:serine/threonine protein kinase
MFLFLICSYFLGVSYMHAKNIVHRDLKLENLLLDRNRNVIITDFGFANQFDVEQGDLMSTSCGSPCYAAPELVVSEGMYVGTAVDIWSCGVILYAMLAGYLPFDDDPANPDGDNINLLYKYILATPLVFPDYISADARDLLRKMLVPDPRRRCTMDVIKKHRWLAPYAHIFEERYDEEPVTGAAAVVVPPPARVPSPTTSYLPAASTTQLTTDSLAPPSRTADPKRHTIQLEYNNNPSEAEPLVDEASVSRFRDEQGLASMDEETTVTVNVPTLQVEDVSAQEENAVPSTKQAKKPPSRPTKARPTTMMLPFSRTAGEEEDDVVSELPNTSSRRGSSRRASQAGDTASVHSNQSQGESDRRTTANGWLSADRRPSGAQTMPGRSRRKTKALSAVMTIGWSSIFGHEQRTHTTIHEHTTLSEVSPGAAAIKPSRTTGSTSTAKRVMDWFRKRSLGKSTHREEFTRGSVLPSEDAKLRTHGGAIDDGALTSRPPKEVVAEIRTLLLSLGLEILKESEYKFKCRRPSRNATMRAAAANGTNGGQEGTLPTPAGNAWKRTSTLRGLLSGRRGSTPHAHEVPSAPPSVASAPADEAASSTPPTATAVAAKDNNGATFIGGTIYGEPGIDSGEEIRFVIEVCKIRNLNNLYIVDIRRRKGSIWSYKFIYHYLLEHLDLKSKGFMDVQGDGTLA